jgi:hypothetical protein
MLDLGRELVLEVRVQLGQRGVDVLLRDPGELLARAARRRGGVVHSQDVAVVPGRDDADRARVDVPIRTRRGGGHGHLARLAVERQRRRLALLLASTPTGRNTSSSVVNAVLLAVLTTDPEGCGRPTSGRSSST